MLQLLPIEASPALNLRFANHPDCQTSYQPTLDYYGIIGFNPPWIGYYAEKNGQLVGSCAFKGGPQNGRVEIAYFTFPVFQHQGMATEMCRELVKIAHQTDPSVIVTARTLPETNYSTRVLEKNGFVLLGTVDDPDDGPVWEWEYR